MFSFVAPRLLSKIVWRPGSDCWWWDGCKTTPGYGTLRFRGRAYKAHRVTYEIYKGPVPEGLEIDHVCKNKACVNPEHLEAVTHQENVRRGEAGRNNRTKTHCLNGHPFAGDNLRTRPNGWRVCRACERHRNLLASLKVEQSDE